MSAHALPTLSIVIPTLDTRDLTLRCLASLGELPAGSEIVVVDDGSRDGTAEAIARFDSAPNPPAASLDPQAPTVRVLRNSTSQGFSRAANRGFEETTGDIVWVLNSDTEVAPNAVAAVRSAFANDPRLAVAGATLRYPDGRPQWSGGPKPSPLWLFAHASGLGERLGRWKRARRKALDVAMTQTLPAIEVDWVTGAAIAIRRSVLQAFAPPQPFDERFRFYAQDLELCTRLRGAGWRVAILPAAHVVHHHGATISKSEGASESRHLELLWTDLVAWAARRSEADRRRAVQALVMGAAVRRLGRAFARPFVPTERIDQFLRQGGALRRALAAIAAVPAPKNSPR